MILYANGCSMTYGHELENMYDAWPYRLAQNLNLNNCVNDGKPGSSNDRIVRTTISWTANYLNQNDNKPFVVVGWSAPSRYECIIDDQWVDIIPQWMPKHNKNIAEATIAYLTHFSDNISDTTRTLNYYVLLQSWLKINKIPYLFFNALHCYYSEAENYLEIIKHIDKKRFYNFHNQNFCFHTFAKPFRSGPKGHPLEEGHLEWAKVLSNYISTNNLLEV